MIHEEYLKLKENDEEKLCLLKKGCFYVTYDIDAIIISRLCNYKVRRFRKYKMVGFPNNTIEKVINHLNALNISYKVYYIQNKNFEYSKEFEKNAYYEILANAIDNDKDIIINNIVEKLNLYSVPKLKNIKNIIDGIN